MLEVGLGLVRLDAERQLEGALPGAIADLLAQVVGALRQLKRLVLALEREGAVEHRDAQVLRAHARHDRAHDQLVLRLPDVHRDGALSRPGGRGEGPHETVLEQAVHGLAKRHEVTEGFQHRRHIYYLLYKQPLWCLYQYHIFSTLSRGVLMTAAYPVWHVKNRGPARRRHWP